MHFPFHPRLELRPPGRGKVQLPNEKNPEEIINLTAEANQLSKEIWKFPTQRQPCEEIVT